LPSLSFLPVRVLALPSLPHHRQGYIVAASEKALYRRLLNGLKEFTCNGQPVSALSNCISNGDLCSDVGTCSAMTGSCVCPDDREGQFCERFKSSSSDASTAVLLGA
jgi:hypothetical protein